MSGIIGKYMENGFYDDDDDDDEDFEELLNGYIIKS